MPINIEKPPKILDQAREEPPWQVNFATPAMALIVPEAASGVELPLHQHASGQLILALSGAVTCHVPGSVWIVPTGCAVWVPAGLQHRSPATPNSRMCFLFVRPNAASLPERCCTLEITPMVREMILHLVDLPRGSHADDHELRLMKVLLTELELMPAGGLRLPVSSHPKLVLIQDALMADPSDRMTLPEWSRRIAISERTLARLIVRETGMTFGRWRQQLHLLVALSQLSDGISVKRIADALGYDTATSFITMFRNRVGTTPSRYANRVVMAYSKSGITLQRTGSFVEADAAPE